MVVNINNIRYFKKLIIDVWVRFIFLNDFIIIEVNMVLFRIDFINNIDNKIIFFFFVFIDIKFFYMFILF